LIYIIKKNFYGGSEVVLEFDKMYMEINEQKFPIKEKDK